MNDNFQEGYPGVNPTCESADEAISHNPRLFFAPMQPGAARRDVKVVCSTNRLLSARAQPEEHDQQFKIWWVDMLVWQKGTLILFSIFYWCTAKKLNWENFTQETSRAFLAVGLYVGALFLGNRIHAK